MRILRNGIASASARHASARHTKIGLGLVIGGLLVALTGGKAVAKRGRQHLRARHVVAVRCGAESARWVQLVSQQPLHLGPMRYYGGPKSPMWRGPVEN